MNTLPLIRHHGILKNLDLAGFTVNFQLHGCRARCPVVQAAKSTSARRRAVRADGFQYGVIAKSLDAGCYVTEGKALFGAPLSTVRDPPLSWFSPVDFV